MRNKLPPAAFSAALLMASPAGAYEDMVSGFAITPPAPFEVEIGTRPAPGLLVGIVSTTGEPPKAGTGPFLCEINYEPAPANNELSQERINQLTEADWRIQQITQGFAPLFEIDSYGFFDLGAARGMELVLTPRTGPDAETSRLVMSLTETPKARFTMACATPETAIETALPQFRAIRDTARLP